MIIGIEKNAVTAEMKAPFERTLKVLLSPVLNPELKSIAMGLTIIPAGSKSDNHAHSEGEMFYVVSGKGHILVGDEEEYVESGTAVWGPPEISHQIINDSGDILKVLWVLSPPGREAAIIADSNRSLNHNNKASFRSL